MTLPDLITLLEGAEAGSRELDVEIATGVAGMTKTNRLAEWPSLEPQWEFTDGRTSGSEPVMVPRYTTSVDAAIALVAKVLPGRRWTVDYTESPNSTIWTFVEDAWRCSEEVYQVVGSTPAIALVLATLQALRALTMSDIHREQPLEEAND